MCLFKQQNNKTQENLTNERSQERSLVECSAVLNVNDNEKLIPTICIWGTDNWPGNYASRPRAWLDIFKSFVGVFFGLKH